MIAFFDETINVVKIDRINFYAHFCAFLPRDKRKNAKKAWKPWVFLPG